MWTQGKDKELLRLWHSTEWFEMENDDIEEYFETDFEDIQERLIYLMTQEEKYEEGLRRYEEFNEIDKIKKAGLPQINESDIQNVILDIELFGKKRKSYDKKSK